MRGSASSKTAVFLAGFIAFWVFFRSLAPGVLSYDFAEFQYLPARMGLPHPNGFPLYMLLGWLWSHVPLGSLAYRMNLLSAVCGAGAVSVFAGLVASITGRPAVALLGAGFLAFVRAFWFYSVGAERYTLEMLLILGALLAAWRWGREPRTRHAAAGALCLGAGLATHPGVALLVPFWGLYHLLRHPRRFLHPRTLFVAASAAAFPLILYLYVPWRWRALAAYPVLPGLGRSEAVFRGLTHVWYTPHGGRGVIRAYVLGLGGFAWGMLHLDGRALLALARESLALLGREFPIAMVPLAAVGLFYLFKRDWAFGASLAGFAGLDALTTVYIRQGKPDAYVLPALGVLALGVALAADAFAAAWKRARLPHPEAVSVALFAALVLAQHRAGDPRILRERFAGVEPWWREVLSYPLEEGSALLAHWGDLTPLWYFQHAEGIRPDLLGLFPPAEEVVSGWLQTGRPLFLAGPLHGWLPGIAERYRLVPWGKLTLILPRDGEFRCPASEPVKHQPPDWPIALTGRDASSPVVSGGVGHVALCWEATEELTTRVYVRMRLSSPEGGLLLQRDEPLLPAWYPAPSVETGAQGVAWVVFEVPAGTPPGDYTLSLELYTLHEDGAWTAWPGEWRIPIEVRPAQSFSLERTDVPFLPVPWAGPLRLLAYSLSEGPVRPGDPLRLDLVWQASGPPRADYKVAFRFVGPQGVLKQTEPVHLAAGYPTAWWSRGQVVRGTYDLRAPKVPGDRFIWLEPVVYSPWGIRAWRPWPVIFVGPLRVRDRSHLWELPGGLEPVEAFFGDVAELAGYALSSETLAPGDTLEVTLYWKALAETELSYTVFVHLVDGTGRVVAQHDGIPGDGTLPTEIWVPGEFIEDVHVIPIPRELRPGTYTLLVGLYRRDTMERLPLGSGGDALRLVSLRVD